MTQIRIIPKLDIKNGFLIKGINLDGLRILGDPNDFALNYYNNNADEIIYLDSVATLYGTNNLQNFMNRVYSFLYGNAIFSQTRSYFLFIFHIFSLSSVNRTEASSI